MATCDLWLHLEKGARYRPGETIRGELQVKADRDCEAKAVLVELGWSATGKGTPAKVDVAALALGEHSMKAGEVFGLPFELVAPDGPLSHEGTVMSVKWEIRASIDLPWALDPKARATIELVPWEEQPILKAADGYRGQAQRWEGDYDLGAVDPVDGEWISKAGTGTRMELVWVGLIVGVAALIAAVLDASAPNARVDRSPTRNRSLLRDVPGGLWVLSAAGFIGAIYAYLTSARFSGSTKLRVSPRDVRGGESIQIDIELDPRRAWKVRRVRAKLRGFEHAQRPDRLSRRGNAMKDFDHTFFEKEVELLGKPRSLSEPLTLSKAMKVPVGSAPSFTAPRNHIKWEVIAVVELDGAIDRECAAPLIVRPPRPPDSDVPKKKSAKRKKRKHAPGAET